MPRIPIYEQQLVPNTAPRSARISAGSTGRGLQAVGEGLDRIVGALDRREEVDFRLGQQAIAIERERIETEGRAWFAKSSSQFDLDQAEFLRKSQESAPAGAGNFTPTYLEKFDKVAGETLTNAPSQFARQLMAAHLSRSREAYGRSAMAWEAGERARFTGQQTDEGINMSASLVNANPALFEQEMGKWTSTIRGYSVDEAAKAKMTDSARTNLVGAAIKGWIDKNPTVAATILKDWASSADGRDNVVTTKLNGQEVRVPIGLADFKQQVALIDYAERKFEEVRQDSAVVLRYEIQNVEAMARSGVAPTGPERPREDFMAVFKDPVTAEREYARYTTARQTATAVASLNGKSTTELLSVVQAKPDARDPNFAVVAANQEIRARAAAEIVRARAEDPVAYAIQSGDFKLQPLNPQQPAQFAEELKRRAAALPVMTEKYGRGQMLSKEEAKAMALQLEVLPADRKVEQLESIRGAIGDDAVYASVLNSMRPDSPVTALVGNIAAAGARGNARMIARGEDLLNPSKASRGGDGGKGSAFPMPQEALMRQAWVDAVGDAYRGYPDAEASAYQAFRAYYAAAAADKGLNDPKASPDDRILQAAIQASTGGVMRWKTDLFGNDTPSANIVLPYGMPADKFRDRVSAEWLRIRDGLGYSKTGPGDIGLYNTGANGEYMVMSGKSWLPDKDGKPVMLRITGAAPSVAAPAPAAGQTRVSPREVRGTVTPLEPVQIQRSPVGPGVTVEGR